MQLDQLRRLRCPHDHTSTFMYKYGDLCQFDMCCSDCGQQLDKEIVKLSENEDAFSIMMKWMEERNATDAQ